MELRTTSTSKNPCVAVNYKNLCAVIVLSVFIVVLVAACASEYLFWFGGSRVHQYICPNGTPHHYRDEQENVVRCVECDEGYIITNDDHCDAVLTVSAQPLQRGELTASTAEFTLTVPVSVELWWVVYKDNVTIDDADTVIQNAQAGGGTDATVAKGSGSNGIAIVGDNPFNIKVEGLTESSAYTFYAAIRKSSTNESRLLNKLQFATTALNTYAFICDNGTPADGMTAANPSTNQCKSCDDGFYLDGTDFACKEGNAFMCANGTRADGLAPNASSSKCKACDGDYFLDPSDELCKSGHAYMCENGTPVHGEAPNDNTNLCKDCDTGYILDTNELSCNPPPTYAFICANGMPADGMTAPNPNTNRCKECNSGYFLDPTDELCKAGHAYVCANGMPADGMTAPNPNTNRCKDCDTGYILDTDDLSCKPPPTYAFICANGTPVAGETDTLDVTNCQSCDDFFKLDPTNTSCVATVYTCQNGMAHSGKPNNVDDFMVEDKNANIEKCAECDDGYAKTDDDTCIVLYDYICINGTAHGGKVPVIDTTKCISCNSGHYRDASDDTCRAGNAYLCDNGTQADGLAPNASSSKCKACDGDYFLDPSDELCKSGHAYVCENGTPVHGEADEPNVTNCQSCEEFYKINPTTLSCEPTTYTCSNGKAAEGGPNFVDDFMAVDKNGDIEKCVRCDFGHELENGMCTLTTVGRWKFDTNSSCSATSACVVSMRADGSLKWEGNCSPHAPLDTLDSYVIDGVLITFGGDNSQFDYTVDVVSKSIVHNPHSTAFILNPHSTTLSGNRYLCPFIGANITPLEAVGDIGLDGGEFTTTVSHDGTLYWAVYADDAVVADAATLIAGIRDGTAGDAQADAGIAVRAGDVSFTVDGLDAVKDYDLYVAFDTAVDGVAQLILSEKYDFTTAGYPFRCENGTASMGESASRDINNCIACTTGYSLVDGAYGKVCAEGYPYVCQDGTADTSARSPTENVNRCTDCDPGFTLGSFSRGCGRQIDLQSYNDVPEDIWSDGTTMWVLDKTDDKLYAYTIDTDTRDTAKEFDLAAANSDPQNIWSDGTTMWVLDLDDRKLFAYTLANGTRDTTKEFDVAGDHGAPRGMWSDGTTMWVSDIDDNKLYAYALPDDDTATTNDGMPDTAKDIDLDTDNDSAQRVTGDGTTIWVSDPADNKLYAYTVAHCIDTDTSTECRDATRDLDIDIATANGRAFGIWTNGSTMWIADIIADTVYAYIIANCTDGDDTTLCSDTDQEIVLDTTNGAPYGTWTDGTTIWVADSEDGRLYAYTLATGSRDTAKEIDLHADNYAPFGIWSDGTTMWVAQNNGTVEGDKVFAYTLATGARDMAKGFDLDSASRLPNGIWSDGTTMWVVDQITDHTFAYVLPDDDPNTTNDGMRDTSNEFTYHRTTDVGGVWSDGTTMWIINNRAHNGVRTVFAYELPNGDSSTATVGTRDTEKDFTTEASELYGVTSDGTTFWMSERVNDILLVY